MRQKREEAVVLGRVITYPPLALIPEGSDPVVIRRNFMLIMQALQRIEEGTLNYMVVRNDDDDVCYTETDNDPVLTPIL